MRDEGWSDDTEVEINDEDIDVSWEFCSCYGISSRAKNQPQDNDPDDDEYALENECQNRPIKVGIFCGPPELKMPGVNQRPEDEGGTQSSK